MDTLSEGRLAKAVGVVAVLASAVSQEYGSGINLVLVDSLGQYPEVKWLVPLAMVVAGLLLAPQTALFARFSQVMPRAGSTYVWLTRSTNLPVGFIVAFVWFIGVVGAMGFLAFAFGTFVGGAFSSLGLPSGWATTSAGHLVLGLALIWVLFLLHYSGVGNYGAFVKVILVLVLIAAAVTIFYGFATSQQTFLGALGQKLGSTPEPPASPGSPSARSFFSVVTVFVFAYAGLTAATSLGGEAENATRTMPRGVLLGWAVALVLYSLISFSLFHAVPWWVVHPLVGSGHSSLATVPGFIGLIAPKFVGAVLNVLVAVIVGKTVAPALLDCSRYMFAWAQDGLLPGAFLHTSKSKAPDMALFVGALLGSLFLVEATFGGWQIGVLLRSMSVVLVFGVLGVGALIARFSPRHSEASWARGLVRHPDVLVAAVLAIIIGVVLEASVLVVPGQPLVLQPSFQAAVSVVIAIVVYTLASRKASRKGESLVASTAEPPLE